MNEPNDEQQYKSKQINSNKIESNQTNNSQRTVFDISLGNLNSENIKENYKKIWEKNLTDLQNEQNIRNKPDDIANWLESHFRTLDFSQTEKAKIEGFHNKALEASKNKDLDDISYDVNKYWSTYFNLLNAYLEKKRNNIQEDEDDKDIVNTVANNIDFLSPQNKPLLTSVINNPEHKAKLEDKVDEKGNKTATHIKIETNDDTFKDEPPIVVHKDKLSLPVKKDEPLSKAKEQLLTYMANMVMAAIQNEIALKGLNGKAADDLRSVEVRGGNEKGLEFMKHVYENAKPPFTVMTEHTVTNTNTPRFG